MRPMTSRNGFPGYDFSRHCEPTGRANARPMTDSAKQSIERQERLDCFVAEFIIGPAEGGTRWLLAMTIRTGSANGESSDSSRDLRRSMPVRKSLFRDRCARALGLARSFSCEPARAWRGLRDLCRKLAQAFSHHQGQGCHHTLRGQGHKNRAQLLLALRHPADLRARAFTAH